MFRQNNKSKTNYNQNSNNKISILHQNIQHLPSRLDMLSILLDEISVDLLVLTEHKMKENEINRLNIKNMTVKSFYTRKLTCGGGVLILARSALKVETLKLPEITSLVQDKEFECCVVKVRAGKYSFILAGIYRTPKVCYDKIFLEKFDLLLEILNRNHKNIVVVGDVNIDVLEESKNKKLLFNVLNSNHIKALVNFPTRICKTKKSAIDNVFTNIAKSKIKVSGIITELSDHDAQLCVITDNGIEISKIQKTIVTYRRKFTDDSIAQFCKLLESENWINVFNAPVNNKFDIFFDIIKYDFDVCFPKVKSRLTRGNSNWITDDIINLKKRCFRFE